MAHASQAKAPTKAPLILQPLPKLQDKLADELRMLRKEIADSHGVFIY